MIHKIFFRSGALLGLFCLALTAAAQTPAAPQADDTGAFLTELPLLEEPGAAADSATAMEENAPLSDDGAPDATATPAVSTLPQAHDLSPWGMYLMADWVVKAVMIGLALASLATWTVLIAKSRELHGLVRRQKQAFAIVNEAQGLSDANQRLEESRSVTDLAHAAAEELRLSADTLADPEGIKERVASRLDRIEAARGRKAARGTSILATIGAVAPFVGLFGTVWGIMNSFIGIAESQTTNLAVVAPGIAEALLATAIGLVAAIPAVVIYNHFARQISAYRALVGDTSAAVLRLVSRDLSRFSVTGQNVFIKE